MLAALQDEVYGFLCFFITTFVYLNEITSKRGQSLYKGQKALSFLSEITVLFLGGGGGGGQIYKLVQVKSKLCGKTVMYL